MVHRGVRALGQVLTRPPSQIKLGWELTGEMVNDRKKNNNLDNLKPCKGLFSYSSIDDLVDPFSFFNIKRKKKPDIPQSIRNRLYGVPGKNIFNYDLERPRLHRKLTDHLDDDLVPMCEPKMPCRNMARHCEFLKGSLDDSLMPKPSCTLKPIDRAILRQRQESQLKDTLVKSQKKPLAPCRALESNLDVSLNVPWHFQASLVPKVQARPCRRRQFKREPTQLPLATKSEQINDNEAGSD
ncbi:hypothetical protein BdWA1_000231 [Babesia duncani]|uniref:Uncharacterized protein n=1 Tax=Babesia duncani TaxID=323732 RepID=A0AAD9UPU5_9APIC|nr:hypothetical protein BdWA1_000231 [Babesia duncani]